MCASTARLGESSLGVSSVLYASLTDGGFNEYNHMHTRTRAQKHAITNAHVHTPANTRTDSTCRLKHTFVLVYTVE
jgi:hypothetical protein